MPKRARAVYLPAGCDWIDFWSGRRYAGGQTIEASAPLEIVPLFVRAGAILPLGPKVQYSDEQLDGAWELRIYPGADGAFDVYEDAGDGYDYERGAYAWTHIGWHDATRTLTVAERETESGFEGMVAQREIHVVLVAEGHGVGLEPEQNPDRTVTFAGARLEDRIERE
jgi:alpha-D-xyloside xylohydrolase